MLACVGIPVTPRDLYVNFIKKSEQIFFVLFFFCVTFDKLCHTYSVIRTTNHWSLHFLRHFWSDGCQWAHFTEVRICQCKRSKKSDSNALFAKFGDHCFATLGITNLIVTFKNPQIRLSPKARIRTILRLDSAQVFTQDRPTFAVKRPCTLCARLTDKKTKMQNSLAEDPSMISIARIFVPVALVRTKIIL